MILPTYSSITCRRKTPPPNMALCVIAHIQKYRSNYEILGTTPMSPLENMAEKDTWSLGERGSFYDQLGVRLLDQVDDVMAEIGRSYLNGDLHVAVNGDFARNTTQ
jgi:hypothetical protein